MDGSLNMFLNTLIYLITNLHNYIRYVYILIFRNKTKIVIT